jgi:hypothetical protein
LPALRYILADQRMNHLRFLRIIFPAIHSVIKGGGFRIHRSIRVYLCESVSLFCRDRGTIWLLKYNSKWQVYHSEQVLSRSVGRLSFEPILLAPEEEVEEVYPYRRVWRTSWLEVSVLLVAVLAIYVLTNLISVLPADLNARLPKVGIALLPLAAWLIFSYRGERRALRPRQGLVGVLVLGGLAANGVAVPLEEHLFTPEQWLTGAGFFGRVIGYTLTIGFTAGFLKYAVLRYTIWPGRISQRLDSIAYALAASMGYAVALNLQAALFSDATLIATALRVASITFSHLGIGVIIGFFMAELVIGKTTVFWIPMGLGLAALLSGLYYGFRGIAIVGGLSLTGTGAAPIRGLTLAFGLVALLFVIVAFLIANADARLEAQAERFRL